MRQIDITAGDVLDVRRLWQTFLEGQDAASLDKMPGLPGWHIYEAEQYLIMAACAHLHMPVPTAVSFSDMNAIERSCTAEVYIFWAEGKTASLADGRLVPGSAVCLDEYHWAGKEMFTKTSDHIEYVIWRMSILKAMLDKEGMPCISGR